VLEQEEPLKHETEVRAAQLGGLAFGQPADVLAVEQVLALVGPVEAASVAGLV